MKKAFQGEGQVIPKKVVQLLKNGKIANLPLKKGFGNYVRKSAAAWTNASSTTSSENTTITFFDDTRALQTITDNATLKMRVITLNPDGTLGPEGLGPVYTYGSGYRLFAIKRSDTEIMIVGMKNTVTLEVHFVTIDESGNLSFQTVPLLTIPAAVANNEYTFDITTVDDAGNTFVIGANYSAAPFNTVLIPFKVTGQTVQAGSVFVFDAQYGSGNKNMAVSSWEPGKIVIHHTANNTNFSPLFSTFAIDDNLQISLLYRDTYANSDFSVEVLINPRMKKLSEGRVALMYRSSSVQLTMRTIEFSKSGVPIFSQKKTLISGGKAMSTTLGFEVTGQDVGIIFGRSTVGSTDPLYTRSLIYPWAVDGDEVSAGDPVIYDDAVQILNASDRPGFAFNKSGDRFLISQLHNDNYTIWLYLFEVQEKQQLGKVLGIAESSNTVALSGAVSGLEGLVPGDEYSYDANGDLVSKSQYTQNGAIGRAVSPSTLLLYDYLLK